MTSLQKKTKVPPSNQTVRRTSKRKSPVIIYYYNNTTLYAVINKSFSLRWIRLNCSNRQTQPKRFEKQRPFIAKILPAGVVATTTHTRELCVTEQPLAFTRKPHVHQYYYCTSTQNFKVAVSWSSLTCYFCAVDDVETTYTPLAMGVSQVQLLCLHAVVGREITFESVV